MIEVWFLCVFYVGAGHACMVQDSAAACVVAEKHLPRAVVEKSECEPALVRDPLWPNGYPPIPAARSSWKAGS